MQGRTSVIRLAAVAAASIAWPASAIVTLNDPGQFEVSPGTVFRQENIVELTVSFERGAFERCSGTVLRTGNVLTAAHCFEDATRSERGKATQVEIRFGGAASGTTVTSKRWEAATGWNGQIGGPGPDIAVVELPGGPPPEAQGLPVARFSDPGSDAFYPLLIWIAGYGDGGQGMVDPSLVPQMRADGSIEPGTLRLALNHYDPFDSSGDGTFEGYLVYDFDDYSETNNKIGLAGYEEFTGQSGTVRTEPTIDSNLDGSFVIGEGMIAAGDSGGPSLVDIFIVGVHSFVTTPNAEPGDLGIDEIVPAAIPGSIDVGFGSLGGDVNVALYADWIESVSFATPVPLPPSAVLLSAALGALMIRSKARRRTER